MRLVYLEIAAAKIFEGDEVTIWKEAGAMLADEEPKVMDKGCGKMLGPLCWLSTPTDHTTKKIIGDMSICFAGGKDDSNYFGGSRCRKYANSGYVGCISSTRGPFLGPLLVLG